MSDAKDLNKYPYPSKDYVPFAFNVKKIDEFVNSTDEHTDNRKDRNALTWFGIEEANRRAREALNYKEVEYVAGNKIDGLLQYVIAPDGNAYQISPATPLPYELTGDWATDSPNFMLMGDLPLRNELASSGGGMIGVNHPVVGDVTLQESIDYSSVVVGSISDLKKLKKTTARFAITTGYYEPSDGGGSYYYLDLSDTSSEDDGGGVIVANDGGRWKLNSSGLVSSRQFGAKPDGSDSTLNIQNLFNFLEKGVAYFPSGVYSTSSVTIPNSIVIKGDNPNGANYNATRIKCTNTTGSTFLVNGAASQFLDIQFFGASNDANGGGDISQTIIEYSPGSAHNYNADGYIQGCSFLFATVCVELRGRNLKAVNCLFSNSKYGIAIRDRDIPDFRGLDVKQCRFHYMSVSAGDIFNPLSGSAIFIDPLTKFHTIDISGCLSDGGKWFYVGHMPWANIHGNTFVAQQGPVFYGYIDGSPSLGAAFQSASISGNYINGTYITSTEEFINYGAIHIENGWGISIKGNEIVNAPGTAIHNKAAGSDISGNTIIEAGWAFKDKSYIKSSGNNSIVKNNSLIKKNTSSINVPRDGIELSAFTYVGGNSFSGTFEREWNLSLMGNNLVYGAMDIVALPSESWGTAAPTSGRYLIGSKVWNTNPQASGTLGWVCTSSGTPGIWKGFGGIA